MQGFTRFGSLLRQETDEERALAFSRASGIACRALQAETMLVLSSCIIEGGVRNFDDVRTKARRTFLIVLRARPERGLDGRVRGPARRHRHRCGWVLEAARQHAEQAEQRRRRHGFRRRLSLGLVAPIVLDVGVARSRRRREDERVLEGACRRLHRGRLERRAVERRSLRQGGHGWKRRPFPRAVRPGKLRVGGEHHPETLVRIRTARPQHLRVRLRRALPSTSEASRVGRRRWQRSIWQRAIDENQPTEESAARSTVTPRRAPYSPRHRERDAVSTTAWTPLDDAKETTRPAASRERLRAARRWRRPHTVNRRKRRRSASAARWAYAPGQARTAR